MNMISRKIDAALNEYETLAGNFEKLISTANIDLKDIKRLSIIKTSKDNLKIQIMGKIISIQFSMVFQDPENPLGQISANLIQNEGTPLHTETTILSMWFDYLGNIKGPLIENNTTSCISQDSYLKKYIYNVIQVLLPSEHFAPKINNL